MKNESNFLFGKIKNIFNKKKEINKTDWDKKLVYSLSSSRIPKIRQIKYIGKYLTSGEAKIIKISFLLILISSIFLGFRLYGRHVVKLPEVGGEYIEGLLGRPHYINPLYADLNNVDRDLSSLIFSSLYKRNSKGELVGDLATKSEMSADGKIYTIKILPNVKWHNDTILNADDVVFTFSALQNKDFNSPLIRQFEGVTIERIDDETIKFILPNPYNSFLSLLTFGIISQEIWSQVDPSNARLADYNLKPIGSGPYRFNSLSRDTDGSLKSYSLVVNNNYYAKKPYIKDLSFRIFNTVEEEVQSLNNHSIDGFYYNSKQLEKSIMVKSSAHININRTNQEVNLFLNQKSNTILNDVNVRKALSLSINKNDILQNIFGNEASSIDGPLLSDNIYYSQPNGIDNYDFFAATKILEDNGWKILEITDADITQIEQNKANGATLSSTDEDKLAIGAGKWRFKDRFLVLKLTAGDYGEFSLAADKIKENWESLGVKVVLEKVSLDQMPTEIIRPRNYEVLLYGQALGSDSDLYGFWHSSQANSRGGNLANYINKEVDALLEDARFTSDLNQRKEKYQRIQSILREERPAIFFYSPAFYYIQDKKIINNSNSKIYFSSDRFANIADWYIETESKINW